MLTALFIYLDHNLVSSFATSAPLREIKEIFTSVEMDSLIEDGETQVWENKVLKNYIASDRTNSHPRLKQIPATRKKRLVILKWLANHFEIGVNYPEPKVNEILKRYHPDCATLRRELIGYQLMQRENGVYWRYCTNAIA